MPLLIVLLPLAVVLGTALALKENVPEIFWVVRSNLVIVMVQFPGGTSEDQELWLPPANEPWIKVAFAFAGPV